MAIYRLHGDDQGETHLTRVELPVVENPGEGVNRVRSLGFPTMRAGVSELTDRMPDFGLHEAPRRRLLVLLAGEYEITTTTGDQVRLRRGDCMFADDIGSKGHYTRDAGEEMLMLVGIEIPDDWEFPAL